MPAFRHTLYFATNLFYTLGRLGWVWGSGAVALFFE